MVQFIIFCLTYNGCSTNIVIVLIRPISTMKTDCIKCLSFVIWSNVILFIFNFYYVVEMHWSN